MQEKMLLGRPVIRHPDEYVESLAVYRKIAERLPSFDTILMHGSCIAVDGEGYLFTAKSGTGKSTHARLWREAFGDRVWMINDDKPMLRIEETGVMVYGTPWDGKHHLSRNASVPLKAIVNLTRDESNHIGPMSRADAFPVLMKQCYGSRNPATMARIMELEKQLLGAVDFYTLGCNMLPEAAKVAWEGIHSPERAERK